ncbi:phage protease [Mesorhizobium sp. ES1-1]|uniref:phage protease n=1 Tax=Mesorhizobium sp. ES1-1 TaxID=2876629 RepID=UPI001CC99DD0|nr:phage protease [Mesorhizobium sp. ES1-1]MBZ9678903.1 phage protease [Mesorhizobium sp. ES1-1]
MSKPILSAFAAPVYQLTPADAGAGHWVQLCPAGTFKARDGRGPFEAGSGSALQAIIDRTKEIAGATELVIDYDHQSVFGAIEGVGGTAKAAGWVKELEVRADGIWGRVEWTPAASEAIKAGEYRYLSPVLLQSKATGKVLAIRMAALTNTPALDLAQVAASANFSETSAEGDPMDKILSALGLAAGSNEDAVLSAITSLKASASAVALAAGVAETATSDQVIAAFKEKAKPDPAQFVPLSALQELQNTVKVLQNSLSADKAEAAVELAIKKGQLSPGMKEWGLDLAKTDLAKFEAFAAGAPVLTAPQLTGATKRKDGDAPILDEAQAQVAAALGVDPKTYAATLAAEQAKLETL